MPVIYGGQLVHRFDVSLTQNVGTTMSMDFTRIDCEQFSQNCAHQNFRIHRLNCLFVRLLILGIFMAIAGTAAYAAVPTVSSVSPNNGPTSGGTAVTISGTNFASTAIVTFGDVAATSVVVVNSTTITATTPAGSVGAANVRVINSRGQSATLANGFIYNGAGGISFVQVAAATPQTPTATVNVSYPAAQAQGNLNVVVVGWNDTTALVQSVKDSAGNTYNLAIGPTSGTALRQSIYYAPNIVGGSNTLTVAFNQAAIAPDVRILEYRGVTTLDVTSGASGNSTIASSGSAATTSANELIFAADTIFTMTNGAGTGFTTRIVTSPDGDIAEDAIASVAGTGAASATLTSPGPWVMQMATFSAGSGTGNSPSVAPTISTVAPNSGSTLGGTAVTITGANFAAGATVKFGTAAATNVVVVNSTTITTTTPAGSAGAASVTVTNSRGQGGILTGAFTYVATVLPTPTFSVAGGTYTTAQTVTISDATTGATIYYTTNGTTPTTSSVRYTGPITVSATETLKAIAAETNYTTSAVATATYTITPVATPVFSPAAGTYTSTQSVAISDATSGATIYYTTNGTTPTTSSTKYNAAITVSTTETIEAIAIKTSSTNSAVATATYTIAPVLPTPTFSVASGTYTTTQTVTINDSTAGTTIYYTTNGSTPTTSSTKYTGAITVSATETLKAIAAKTGFTTSAVGTASYTIALTVAAPSFSPIAGTYTTTQTVTLSDATPGATIYYTTNGTTPTTSSTKYTGAITVSTTETIKAIAILTGSTNSTVATAAYTISPPVANPTFSPAAGTYATTQTVSISDITSGATIYYTTNGTTPTTSSTKYTGAITVSATETIEAIAVATGLTNSAVVIATYTIAPTLPTPIFSVPAGTYTSAQNVTISDATSGVTIYYTTNGTTPTTSSTKYTGAITVSATETIEAIATKSGSTNSAVAKAIYTIKAASSVDLSWAAPSSSPSPVVGYNIYRSVGAGSTAFQLLNPTVDTATTYMDSTVQSGVTYNYMVESVDGNGVESVPSNEVSVTIP